ncbi:hypothetical protein RJT34_26835 [Clitoria ternatea]|uniref:Photosynthesis system II assembly factor Ycf48/Hcf136-like domain-containing protein n=1 Tax=Clitoria ternatea TaxID=43366 RepID=A0AAN9F7A7_CLITE
MEGTLGLRVQYPLLKKISTTGSILSASKEKKVGLLVYIKATGEKGAEMVTEEGAIYVTSNRGYNWKAVVQETVSATLNRTVSSGISGTSYYTGTFNTVNRSPDGRYVAVSSRGNFYLTWEPGQVKKVVGWEKKRTLHPRRGGGFDGGSIIGRIGFGNWKGIGLVIMAVVAGVWKQRRGNVKRPNLDKLKMKNTELAEVVKKNLETIEDLRAENNKLADEKRRFEELNETLETKF